MSSEHRPASGGYVVDCRGAWLRAQVRSVATIISVTGCIDGTNVESIMRNLVRFTALDHPLIVDLGEAAPSHGSDVHRLIADFGHICHRDEVEWALVTHPAMSSLDTHLLRAESVAEAMQHFVQAVYARRHLPLTDTGGCRSAPEAPRWRTGS